MNLVVCDDLIALSERAAEIVRASAAAAIAARGRWTVSLAGGSTPRGLYRLLAEPEDRLDEIDWPRARIFFGDERCVPPDHADSNYRMAREALLAPADVPELNVYRMRGEAADLDAAARDYEAVLRREVSDGGAPTLDLAILGMGPDAHTASLFPGTTALDEEQRLCVPVAVPQLRTNRLTLTYPAFLRARDVLFLIAGADKARPLAAVIEGPLSPGTLPCQRIVRRDGPVSIVCDRAAAEILGGNHATTKEGS
jgi:6-phosphogluconolactonase